MSVGFETTTPAACLSVKTAREDGLDELLDSGSEQNDAAGI